MSSQTPLNAMPRAFERAMDDLMEAVWRPEVSVAEIPAPQRIAPYSVAIEADVLAGAADIGSGRLILLHDPAGNPAWDGTFRCVTFARSEVPPEMGQDTLMADVAWSWLVDALTERGALFTAPAGTVTTQASKAFGDLDDNTDARFDVEIRASWTPLLTADGSGFDAHLHAWEELLCLTAGMPQLPDGVTPLATVRNGRRR